MRCLGLAWLRLMSGVMNIEEPNGRFYLSFGGRFGPSFHCQSSVSGPHELSVTKS